LARRPGASNTPGSAPSTPALASNYAFAFSPIKGEEVGMNSLGAVSTEGLMRDVATTVAIVIGFFFLIRFFGPSVARANRVVLNPITRQFAGRAPGFAVIIHRGRTSGRLSRTPVNVFKVREGFVIALTYGPHNDALPAIVGSSGRACVGLSCKTDTLVSKKGSNARIPVKLGGTEMRSQATIVLYILLLIAVVVAVDFLFFKNRFWERLTVNIGIVLVFAAFYFRFLRRP
jgi:hypothetical protein